jgi:hypothetical protein
MPGVFAGLAPLATPAACQASACSGEFGGKADGAAIGVCRRLALIGFDTEKTPVLVK